MNEKDFSVLSRLGASILSDLWDLGHNINQDTNENPL